MDDYEHQRSEGLPLSIIMLNLQSTAEINTDDYWLGKMEEQSRIYDWKRKNLPQPEDIGLQDGPMMEDDHPSPEIGICLCE